MTSFEAKPPSSTDSSCPDCSDFLNWDEEQLGSDFEKTVVFRSLVATLTLQPELDESLEAKTVKFLKFVRPLDRKSLDAFLESLGPTTDESLTNFVQDLRVLISSGSQVITTAAMGILDHLIFVSSVQVQLALVKADLIPQLIVTLNPLALSFTEAVDIHTSLIKTISWSLWLATRIGLRQLEMEDDDGQQSVHETILKQVVTPSEKYICHLCMNRYSIIGGFQSDDFLMLLARLLQISPFYQPTMSVIVTMPIFHSIPSCLTFFEKEFSIWFFIDSMVDFQREWNKKRGDSRHLWKNVHRMLRMEGIEDVIDERLQNDKDRSYGGWISDNSIKLNNLQGMNFPEHW
ncbi:hypothetical protein BLNAU_21356 [Blattamonas nauphoetae]|uniref:Uncharacterized protein n=1 Tax=Blattamonas nauphoetae TaxID=2049346 RepID=A0ABQ9X097_9EUKA|nr:hypothetical protein BLNAU_21356 [Blattamonas nauphoetae]